MSKGLLYVGFLGVGAAALMLTAAVANAQDRIRWKMPSAFGSQLTHLGPSGVRFFKDIERASGGTIEIKFNEPGALVPALQAFEAVSQGSVDAAWSTPASTPARIRHSPCSRRSRSGPAWANTLPGGTAAAELRDEMFAKHGIHNIPCAIIPPEASGWFRKEIKSVDDLKGLKMRFFGLGAKVMEKLGVSTQLLAPGDIFQALQLGTIDATEFSMPSMDQKLGFYQVAKFYYFPGWHQQASMHRDPGEQEVVRRAARAVQGDHRSRRCAAMWIYADARPAVRRHGRDAGQVPGAGQALAGRHAQGVREGLARGGQGRVGQRIRSSRRSPTTSSTYRKKYAIWRVPAPEAHRPELAAPGEHRWAPLVAVTGWLVAPARTARSISSASRPVEGGGMAYTETAHRRSVARRASWGAADPGPDRLRGRRRRRHAAGRTPARSSSSSPRTYLPIGDVVTLAALLFSGYPVAFVLGGVALIFGLIGFLLGSFKLVQFFNFVPRIWGQAAENLVLVAIPTFIFMGVMMERSGIAQDLLYCVQLILKRVPGALALGVTIMGTILAAMTGIIGASVTMMTALALPTMMKQGYSHALSCGTIAAAGTLGILIPPEHHADRHGRPAQGVGRQPVLGGDHSRPDAVGDVSVFIFLAAQAGPRSRRRCRRPADGAQGKLARCCSAPSSRRCSSSAPSSFRSCSAGRRRARPARSARAGRSCSPRCGAGST